MIADRLVHASIIDGMRLCKAMQDTFKHSDMEHLEEKLQEHQDKRARMIITDGVFSMDGDTARLDRIVELAEKYNAMVFLERLIVIVPDLIPSCASRFRNAPRHALERRVFLLRSHRSHRGPM